MYQTKLSNKMCETKYMKQNVSDKMCQTKCVKQNVSNKMCQTKCVEQNVSNKMCQTKCVKQNVSNKMCQTKCGKQICLTFCHKCDFFASKRFFHFPDFSELSNEVHFKTTEFGRRNMNGFESPFSLSLSLS